MLPLICCQLSNHFWTSQPFLSALRTPTWSKLWIHLCGESGSVARLVLSVCWYRFYSIALLSNYKRFFPATNAPVNTTLRPTTAKRKCSTILKTCFIIFCIDDIYLKAKKTIFRLSRLISDKTVTGVYINKKYTPSRLKKLSRDYMTELSIFSNQSQQARITKIVWYYFNPH